LNPGTRRRRFSGELLDVAGAAVLLGVTEKAIRARVARRLLPFKEFGGRIVFIKADLLNFLQQLAGCDVDEALKNVAQRAE
jgi:hypothetical protein